MPIYYEPETCPVVPSALAHRANATATDAAVARGSLEARKRRIDEELRHPAYQRIRQATQGPHFLLYNVLGLGAFPGVVVWEAIVSREIYEVVLPMPLLWWVPIAACAGLGVWASAILAESSDEFRVRSTPDTAVGREQNLARAMKDLYDQSDRKTVGSWTSHPATGLSIAIIVLCIIYGFSLQRVEWLKQEGKATDLLQVYLPVILYAFEIALGMPAYFVAMCHGKRMRLRRLNEELTVLTRNQHTLRQTAIEQYTHYLEEYHGYNTWADQKRLPRAPLIPANVELRRLLTEEFGYDPTQPGASQPDNPSSEASSNHVNGNGGPRVAGNGASSAAEASSSPANGDGGLRAAEDGAPVAAEAAREEQAPATETQVPQTPNDGSREADLLRLVEEQIASQNGRF
jgi:hypothetical protein